MHLTRNLHAKRSSPRKAWVLQSLEAKGWIRRSPSSSNARILETSVTAAGTRALASAGARLARVEELIAGTLSTDELNNLRSVLNRCIEALKETI